MKQLIFCFLTFASTSAFSDPLNHQQLAESCAELLAAPAAEKKTILPGMVIRSGRQIFFVVHRGRTNASISHGWDYYPSTSYIEAVRLNHQGYLDHDPIHIGETPTQKNPLYLGRMEIVGKSEISWGVKNISKFIAPMNTDEVRKGDIISVSSKRFVVVKTYLGKGGTGHGPHDIYPPILVAQAHRLKPDGSLSSKMTEFYIGETHSKGALSKFVVIGTSEPYRIVLSIK